MQAANEPTGAPDVPAGAPPSAAARPAPAEGAVFAGGLADGLSRMFADAMEVLRERLKALVRPTEELLAHERGLDLTLDLDGEEIEAFLGHKRQLFLGYYSQAMAERRLREDGVLTTLEGIAGRPVDVHLDPEAGLLRVCRRGDDPQQSILAEVKARLVTHPGGLLEGSTIEHPERLGLPSDALAPPPPLPAGTFLWIDWMRLQNPFVPAPPGWRGLPGQLHPGLGLGWDVLRVLRRTSNRLRCDAVVATPMHYHNAVMYRRLFAFVDPRAEGLFLALLRDLAGLSFSEAAWAMEEGRVRCAQSGRVVRWHGLPMLFPIRDPWRRYLLAPSYIEPAAQVVERARFTVTPRDGSPPAGAAGEGAGVSAAASAPDTGGGA